MSASDPTMVFGDAAVAADHSFSLEDMQWLQEGAAQTEAAEAPAAIPERDRIPVGRIAGPADLAAPLAPTQPVPMLPVPLRRTVSGRYRSTGATQLELRVDVDGRRPLRRISGDFFAQSGATLVYQGSFIVNTVTVSFTAGMATIEGVGSFTFAASFARVRVRIPRSTIFAPAGAATVQFVSAAGVVGATYTCPHVSGFFRTVQVEEDQVAGVTPFVSYNTGSLAAPPPSRVLSVAGAYAEAGIELQSVGVRNIVSTAGIGAAWSNAELHAAMVSNFSLWRETPQWKVWMLTAHLHDLGPGLLGIMFDQQGLQRQGCAVFHAGLGGTSATKQRDQLYTCVHELGHCFNLYHSFHKQHMTPPQPNRLDSLSWMNYPWYFPGGPAAFWSTFPFQFDDLELVHLRHAFRNHIVMGGNPFGSGAALEDPEAFAAPVVDGSGLRLELRGRKSFALGEPVVVEIKLEATDTRGKEVVANLHPNFGFVQIGIRYPSGRVVPYRPMLEHCAVPGMVTLTPERPAIYESAYIGYGEDGLYFDSPGTYELRAVYQAQDGSRVVSNTLSLRVRSPAQPEDDQVAELLLGDDQGKLFYLLGSDADTLREGNEAIDRVIEEHGSHPLAVYAHLVEGVNAAREFKTISRDGELRVRRPDLEESEESLGAVVEASREGRGLDNISLNFAMRTLADVQEASGREEDAARTAQEMVEHFRAQNLKPFVLEEIEQLAEAYQPGDAHLPAPERRARANHLDS